MNSRFPSFHEKTVQLASRIRESALINHLGERGSAREDSVQEFLRPLLPKRFQLKTGEAYDRLDQRSKQIDILIVDELHASPLFQSYSTGVFPCEMVYGSIEVKSQLDGDGLKKSIENVRSLKILKREATDELDIFPHYRMKLGRYLNFAQSVPSNPYLGCVLAVNSLEPETILNRLDDCISKEPAEKELLPDYFFCLEREFVVLKAKRDKNGFMEIPPGVPFDGYYMMKTGKDTLAFFYMTLMITLSQIRLRAPDLTEIWSNCKANALKNGEFKASKHLLTVGM